MLQTDDEANNPHVNPPPTPTPSSSACNAMFAGWCSLVNSVDAPILTCWLEDGGVGDVGDEDADEPKMLESSGLDAKGFRRKGDVSAVEEVSLMDGDGDGCGTVDIVTIYVLE
jgi:hypothetical protein